MATVAIIQNLHSILHMEDTKTLSGMGKMMYTKFYDVLVEESGHNIHMSRDLDTHLLKYKDEVPDMVICTPLPETGNLAPGLRELKRIREAFPKAPVVVWSNREEAAIQKTVTEEYGAVRYYNGSILDCADDFADIILEYT
jgi:DNA-binding NarL/FixJ family response regulator